VQFLANFAIAKLTLLSKYFVAEVDKNKGLDWLILLR